MLFGELISEQGIKVTRIAKAVFSDRSNFTKRMKRNKIYLDEIKILRHKNILTLEDIDKLTS